MADDAHLHNAARCLRRILSARDPDHVYVVRVRPRDEPLWPLTRLCFIRWLCGSMARGVAQAGSVEG
jgi:hypothetical protein